MDIIKKQTEDYEKSFSLIIKKFEENKHQAITAVNKLLVDIYWFIGKTVVGLQEKGNWGDSVVEKLSQDLRIKYPDQTGFSIRNLWNMKKFYEAYDHIIKLQPLVAEISWTNNIIILDQTNNIEEKEFYLKMCIKERWSKRELQRQIDSAYFERFMLSQKPAELEKIEQKKLKISINDINHHLKDEYILEFLDLAKVFSEKELRQAILDNFRDFFLEFGKNLSFVGEEYPLVVGGETFKVDLLFFHRELQCLVCIELKIGKFKPEYVGKMQFYLATLDEQIRLSHEKPSIGLVLCRSKKESVVRLTLSKSQEPIKVAVYQNKLPTKELIQQKLEKMDFPKQLFEMNNDN